VSVTLNITNVVLINEYNWLILLPHNVFCWLGAAIFGEYIVELWLVILYVTISKVWWSPKNTISSITCIWFSAEFKTEIKFFCCSKV
jgi:hypothetical protein